MEIKFYNMTAPHEVVDKSDYLGTATTMTGDLRDACDIINPVIDIESSSMPSFNYLYIADFNRYYYITDIVCVSRDIWRISMHCDVLMSFASEILSHSAFIDRCETDYNTLLVDGMVPAMNEFTYEAVPVTTNFFEKNPLATTTKQYVLTVSG